MNERFFTWNDLVTYGGAVMAVLIITEFTKDLPGIRRIPTCFLVMKEGAGSHA